MPDKSKQQKEQERVNRIVQLSKQWGVPTNSIFTKVKYQPNDIWTDPKDAAVENREYFTFGPDGKVVKSITDRYENVTRGYSGAMFSPQATPAPFVPNPQDSTNLVKLIPYKNGGSLKFSSMPHKVKYAFGGEMDTNVYGYNPYSVSSQLQNNTPYLPLSPNGSPLNQTMANINNYFATEPSNMVPNEASLQGPDPNEPEYLLNADTNQVAQSNYGPSSTPSPKGKQFKMPNIRFNTAGPIMALAGLTGQMSQQQNQIDQQSRKAKRQMNQETYNPFPYGTGSQAIFGKGGKMKGKMENGGYMIGQTYNLSEDEINLLSSQGYSFDIIS